MLPASTPSVEEEASMTPVAELKQAHRATWAAGDYAAIAEMIDAVPPRDLLARADIRLGHDVLVVATGTGNVAIPAAASGARVVGLDLVPELLEIARNRAEQRGAVVDWVEGDAEDLPFEDGSFDRVLSVFGVQFAPRHRIAARELARVTRPGGLIGLVNWTPGGHIGEMLKIIGSYMPAPPEYASPPALWGVEEHVRSLFEEAPVTLEFARGANPWRFESAEHFVAFFETYYGPMIKARERLTAEGRWEECRAEIVAMAERRNESDDGSLAMNAEYLVTVGRKAAS
jgi:SAM-dependent methyltransferase